MKIILIIIIILFVLLGLFFYLIYSSSKNKSLNCEVIINSSPNEIFIEIGNKTYKTPCKIYLTKNKEYEIIAYKTGYLEKRIKQKIPNQEKYELKIEIKPTIPEDINNGLPDKEQEKHRTKNDTNEEKLKKNWSSRVWSPDYSYVIEYIPDNDTFYIEIKKSNCEDCKEKALNWFKKQKINPDNLNIIWLGLDSEEETKDSVFPGEPDPND